MPQSGWETTMQTLARSRNDAAQGALLQGLTSSDPAVRGTAIRGLLLRRNRAGQLAVLKLRAEMSESERGLLEAGRGRMSGALHEAFLSDDATLFQTACEVTDAFSEYDMIATLVGVSEDPSAEKSNAATDLTVRLIHRLGENLRAVDDAEARREVDAKVKLVLESLERSVERYREHRRSALVEAYMILAGPENRTLRSILESPHHPCFQIVLQTLTASDDPSVVDLLMGLLQTKDAPATVRNVVSRRTDRPFVDALLELALDDASAPIAANVGRIASFAFLDSAGLLVYELDEREQARAMRLVAASGLNSDARLDLVELMLARGATLGRAAAVDLLAKIAGDRSNQLTRLALDDPAPEVQASAARPLRERHVPGVMGKLVELAGSPYDEVRDAAREALADFSFSSYLARYDSLEDSFRQSTGRLVMRIDANAVSELIAEFKSSSRRRQLRAVQVATAMGALPHVKRELLEMLQNEDHLMRATAADALQYCPGEETRLALFEALGDKSHSVRAAAKESLAAMGVDSTVVAARLEAAKANA